MLKSAQKRTYKTLEEKKQYRVQYIIELIKCKTGMDRTETKG